MLFSLASAGLSVFGVMKHLLGHGFSSLVYYTLDSNVFLAVAALIYCGNLFPVLFGWKKAIPGTVRKLKYIATAAISITFFVVLFVLPFYYDSYFAGLRTLLFSGSNLYLHLLSPLCAIASFLCFDPVSERSKALPFLSILPMLAYALVTTLLNLLRVIYGPYPFLRVYEQPVWVSVLWFFGLALFALAIGAGLYLGQRSMRRPPKKR